MRWFLLVFLSFGCSSVSWCDELYLGKSLAQWEQQLTTGSVQEKYLAAWSVAQIGALAEPLIEKHLTHADSVIRTWMVLGVAKMVHQAEIKSHREKHIKQLEQMTHDTAPAVSIIAAESLLRFEQTSGLPALKKWLQHDSAHVRYRALVALDRTWFFEDAELLKLINELNKKPSEYEGRIADRILEQTKK